MGVIINDFDVVVQREPQQAAEEAPPSNAQGASTMMPRDLCEILRQATERKARVRAH